MPPISWTSKWRWPIVRHAPPRGRRRTPRRAGRSGPRPGRAARGTRRSCAASSSSESACISGSSALISGTTAGEVADLLALAGPQDLREHAHDGTVVRRGPCASCSRVAVRLYPAAVRRLRQLVSRRPRGSDPASGVVGTASSERDRRRGGGRRRRVMSTVAKRPGLEPPAGRRGEVHELALARPAREHAAVLRGGSLDDDLLRHGRRGPGCAASAERSTTTFSRANRSAMTSSGARRRSAICGGPGARPRARR